MCPIRQCSAGLQTVDKGEVLERVLGYHERLVGCIQSCYSPSAKGRRHCQGVRLREVPLVS